MVGCTALRTHLPERCPTCAVPFPACTVIRYYKTNTTVYVTIVIRINITKIRVRRPGMRTFYAAHFVCGCTTYIFKNFSNVRIRVESPSCMPGITFTTIAMLV